MKNFLNHLKNQPELGYFFYILRWERKNWLKFQFSDLFINVFVFWWIEKAVKAEAILEEVAPEYWEQACRELMKQDRILKKLIPKYGSGFLVTRGDPFNTLARAWKTSAPICKA